MQNFVKGTSTIVAFRTRPTDKRDKGMELRKKLDKAEDKFRKNGEQPPYNEWTPSMPGIYSYNSPEL